MGLASAELRVVHHAGQGPCTDDEAPACLGRRAARGQTRTRARRPVLVGNNGSSRNPPRSEIHVPPQAAGGAVERDAAVLALLAEAVDVSRVADDSVEDALDHLDHRCGSCRL